MSGHWRFCVAALLLSSAGVSISPAFSNPFTDLFNPPPKEATPPAPVREVCVPQPGRSTAPSQHWVYHVEGHRKCWFQADEATASLTKRIHHYAAKPSAIVREESEAAQRKKTLLDARAQLRSEAPVDTFQPAAAAPEVVDTASVPANGAATLVPAAPIAAQPTTDRPAPNHATPHSVDVETLLAASAPAEDTAASSAPPANPGAPSILDADDGHWESMATRAGEVLIALGLIFLVGSLLASRFLDPRVAPIRRA
jgi:uncharacterized membrane protein